jgi:hypothetical protein
MMEAVRTSETSVDNQFTRQYNPEDSSEHHTRRRENLKYHIARHYPSSNFRILESVFFSVKTCVVVNSNLNDGKYPQKCHGSITQSEKIFNF